MLNSIQPNGYEFQHGLLSLASTPSNNKKLLDSVKKGDLNEVTRLLKLTGMTPNIVDSQGLTPLHIAAQKGHILVALILFKNGGNVNAQSKSMETPLDFAIDLAVREQNFSLAQFLLEKGAQPKYDRLFRKIKDVCFPGLTAEQKKGLVYENFDKILNRNISDELSGNIKILVPRIEVVLVMLKLKMDKSKISELIQEKISDYSALNVMDSETWDYFIPTLNKIAKFANLSKKKKKPKNISQHDKLIKQNAVSTESIKLNQETIAESSPKQLLPTDKLIKPNEASTESMKLNQEPIVESSPKQLLPIGRNTKHTLQYDEYYSLFNGIKKNIIDIKIV